jgi:hypothetical protein
MTARFLPLICLLGCRAEPESPPPKTADLSIPALPEAGAPKAAPRKPLPEEPKLSYEQALARAADAGSMVVDQTDMTDAELSTPMRNAAFVPECGAPSDMKLTVRVAVQRGRAVGVTVTTNPPNDDVARCVDDRIRRDLRWRNTTEKKMDSFTVTY